MIFVDKNIYTFHQYCSTDYSLLTETLNSLRSAMQARQTAEDELQEQLDNMATPEMKAKYKECREAEAQLASLEQKLGKSFL